MDTQNETPNTEHPRADKPGERNLVFRVSAADYLRFSVGRAKRGLKTAEFLGVLLDLAEAQNPKE